MKFRRLKHTTTIGHVELFGARYALKVVPGRLFVDGRECQSIDDHDANEILISDRALDAAVVIGSSIVGVMEALMRHQREDAAAQTKEES